MALSKEWYDAEFVDSESESLHRLQVLNIVFITQSKPGIWNM